MQSQNFLFEIGTEELPARNLQPLMQALQKNFAQELQKAQLTHGTIKTFATPRRLSVLIDDLQTQQPERLIERKGPALNAAYDAQGNPTKALEGFARSCGVDISALQQQKTAQGDWIIYRTQQPGKQAKEILPEIVGKVLQTLPIKKPMRWGKLENTFARPVHWLVMLLGNETINAQFFDITTQNKTYGHRFHHPEAIVLTHADNYLETLEQAKVSADFVKRRNKIENEIKQKAQEKNARLISSPTLSDLLDEVTGLVEWPVPLLGSFDKAFLQLPREVLITTIEVNQRCFPLEDQAGNLLPYFITVSNIESKNPASVIHGNERVIRARLSDAKFFYDLDRKQTLEQRTPGLKNVVFQAKLGNLFDKSQRLRQLTEFLYESEFASRAAELCKADLLTNMVGEFPELQGTMGYYYAQHDHENIETAKAIRDHYLPRFAEDTLPETLAGCALAIADRLDTLVGNFSINQIPTGEKDPFGLRRAALGILRISIDNPSLNLNLNKAIAYSCELYSKQLDKPAPNKENIERFIYERLYNWYADQNISADRLDAVFNDAVANADSQGQRHYPAILHTWVSELNTFIEQRPEIAQKIIAANKRIRNILKTPATQTDKNIDEIPGDHMQYWQAIKSNLLQLPAEIELHKAIEHIIGKPSDKILASPESYRNYLSELADLQSAIDNFFDNVKVMEDNIELQQNRLNLLKALRKIFLRAADFSLLQI